MLKTSELKTLITRCRNGMNSLKDVIVRQSMPLIFSHIKENFSNVDCDKKILILLAQKGIAKTVDIIDEKRIEEFETLAKCCIENEIIKYLKSNDIQYLEVNNSKQIITIYELLKEYSKEEIDLALSQLDEKDKKIIELKYGTDLLNPIKSELYTKEIDYEFYTLVIPKIKKKLAIKSTPAVKRQTVENSKKRVYGKTLYDLLSNYTKEQIDDAITYLSEEDRKIVELRYGPDLSNPIESGQYSKQVSDRFYGTVLQKIKNKLRDKYDGKKKANFTIYELLSKYPKEEVDEVINSLTDDEKKILEMKYGKDLSNPVKSDGYSYDYCEKYFYPLLFKMRRILTNKHKKVRIIYELFSGYSVEQVNEVIENLSEKDKKILEIRYGTDLLNPVASSEYNREFGQKYFNPLIAKIRKKLLNGNKPRKKSDTIYDLVSEFSKEEIDFVISHLNEKDKEIIKIKYGTDLSNPVKTKKIPTKINNSFYGNVLPKIRKRLLANSQPDKKRSDFSIYQLLSDFTKEEVDFLISNLSLEDKKILEVRYGSDLSKPVKGSEFNYKYGQKYFYPLLSRMRRRLNKNRLIAEKEALLNDKISKENYLSIKNFIEILAMKIRKRLFNIRQHTYGFFQI